MQQPQDEQMSQAVAQAVQPLLAQVQALQDQVGQLQAQVTRLEHRSSDTLRVARAYNENAVIKGRRLWPVPHPDTGAMPPAGLFPVMRDDLHDIDDDRAVALLRFYGLPTSGSAKDRRCRLADCWGVLGME